MKCKNCIYFKKYVCERHYSRVFSNNNTCEYFINGDDKYGINKWRLYRRNTKINMNQGDEFL